MNTRGKIFGDIKELSNSAKKIRLKKKKIVLCQGHFNVIHPGHLRFLEFAGKQGDYLIIAIQGKRHLEPKNREKFFNARERARGVASLEVVDGAFIFDEIPFKDVIEVVRPDVYVMGEEFAKRTGEMQDDIRLVEKYGGKVMFRAGEIRYATSDFLEHDLTDLEERHRRQFETALAKLKISKDKLLTYCSRFSDLHMLVIGDTIVDQYIACDPLGMSAEAPVLVVKELEKKEFAGGAAVVSRHIASMGAKCSFISVVGNDEPGEIVKKVLADDKISANLIIDNDRPTTFKTRYMVGHQKLLRVSRLEDIHVNEKIENEIIKHINSLAGSIDGIIVSDFVYGVITPHILEYLLKAKEKHKVKLFGNSQSSSQMGNVGKFLSYDLLVPTEREARLAMDDKYSGLEWVGTNLLKKTKAKNLVLTLAEKGFISFHYDEEEDFVRSQYFPALVVNPVDVLGAGDAMLSALALCICVGANLMESSVIAAGAASVEVSRVGNTPVTFGEIRDWLGNLKSTG